MCCVSKAHLTGTGAADTTVIAAGTAETGGFRPSEKLVVAAVTAAKGKKYISLIELVLFKSYISSQRLRKYPVLIFFYITGQKVQV